MYSVFGANVIVDKNVGFGLPLACLVAALVAAQEALLPFLWRALANAAVLIITSFLQASKAFLQASEAFLLAK
jgi:hypothetical protein